MLIKVKCRDAYWRLKSNPPPFEDCLINTNGIEYVIPIGTESTGPLLKVKMLSGIEINALGEINQFINEAPPDEPYERYRELQNKRHELLSQGIGPHSDIIETLEGEMELLWDKLSQIEKDVLSIRGSIQGDSARCSTKPLS